MTAVEEIVETESERVERWRAEELIRAGYDPVAALDLAARPDIVEAHVSLWCARPGVSMLLRVKP